MRFRLIWPRGEAVVMLGSGVTAHLVGEALPATAAANCWGDEVYFRLPVTADLDDDATDVVDAGTVCYWVEGESIAIPFGPTPVSVGDECRLVTRVNTIGRLEGDPGILATVTEGDRLELLPIEE
jgi:hypothetical protein